MSHESNVYVFFGLPGSGKGSQASRLKKALKIPHISSGDLLREEIKRGSPLGDLINGFIKKGLFPPDEMVIEMVINRTKKQDCQNGYILDGLPRTLNQAQILDQKLLGIHSLIFINITISELDLIERLLGRRVCTQCATNYHVDFAPPKNESQCDRCQAPLMTREDDQKHVIENRIEIFRKHFNPMLKYYHQRPSWIEIDSVGSPQDCFDSLLEKLSPYIEESSLQKSRKALV